MGRKDQRSCKRVREMDRSRKGDEGAVLWRMCMEEMSQKRVNNVRFLEIIVFSFYKTLLWTLTSIRLLT